LAVGAILGAATPAQAAPAQAAPAQAAQAQAQAAQASVHDQIRDAFTAGALAPAAPGFLAVICDPH
jgi:hypothetical protein